MAAAAGMMGPANSRATEQLNILQYVELQRALSESQRHHIKCITAIQGFWALFLTGAKKHGPARLSFSAFQQAVMAVIQHTEAAQAFYQELLDLYPSAIPVQKAYADFARLVLNDYDIADKFDEMVRISKQREEELTRAAPLPLDPSTISGQVELPGAAAPISTLLGFSKVAVITMNGTGVIESVNEAACGVFGYSKSRDLRGRKINTLMPWPYRLFHDSWLERYRVTGEAKLLAKPKDLWGLHSNGWSFPLRLQVVETKIDSKSPQFTGLVTPSGKQNTKTATLLINNQGIIQMATQQMQTILAICLASSSVATFPSSCQTTTPCFLTRARVCPLAGTLKV
ncbi:hypothetical protein BCR44DRAFT_1136368 [Catenaria anguillulae PL171]|uniref:TmcB/TmcC TPR repeats domain-containing protein n=1 Tax=Catenaria anguillulae PL171 TaxID=765915 RepID=A0A1Y2HJW0_9FUNG|nr:hypothetical protein BCR44DRAFT_1136368 [Catenaria anguillulae PL171]